MCGICRLRKYYTEKFSCERRQGKNRRVNEKVIEEMCEGTSTRVRSVCGDKNDFRVRSSSSSRFSIELLSIILLSNGRDSHFMMRRDAKEAVRIVMKMNFDGMRSIRKPMKRWRDRLERNMKRAKEIE